MVRAGISAALVVAALAAPLAQRGDVVVSAAASLADGFGELGRAYQARTGTRVVINAAASNTLARQIAAGAAVDLFISADEAQLDAVRSEIVPGTRVDLLANQLAIAVPADRPRTLRSAGELTDAAFRRIAVGDPDAVPAGVYARTYLEKIGIWKAIAPRIVPSASVRLAMAAVENGAADAAIVYRTDVALSKRAVLAFAVPAAEGPRIVYPAAAIRTGRNRDGASRLLAWLREEPAAVIFRSAGFMPLSTGPAKR